MNKNEEIKTYKPDDIRSPYIILPILFFVMWMGVKIIFTGYNQVSFSKYMFFVILFGSAILFFSFLIYASVINSIYIDTTDKEIIGWNVYKIKRGSLKFPEIALIKVKSKNVLDLILQDVNSKKLSISFSKEFVPLLDEILEKSVNCQRIEIDFDYFIKNRRHPGIEVVKDKYNDKIRKTK